MEFVIGAVMGVAVGGFATVVGFDRSRSFYPVVMIVIASYYCLFAVLGGSAEALWLELALAILFASAAIAGFRVSLWIVVAAIAGHGAMDLVHHHIIDNAGIPTWWPGFCSSIDIVIAVYLAALILLRGKSGAGGAAKSQV